MDKDFKTDLNNWALESIAFIALDTRLQCFDEKNKSPDADILINGMHKFFELSYELDIKPSLWRYFSTPKFNKLMETLDDVTDASIKYIDAAREKMKTQPPKAPAEMSILEKLIKIDRKTAVVMAMDMLFAGIDTGRTFRQLDKGLTMSLGHKVRDLPDELLV
uniref:Uncharacterized protein n=1 Tax=Megaselia scalaris TaxID=36166 RepID=T1H3Y1_MEGSC